MRGRPAWAAATAREPRRDVRSAADEGPLGADRRRGGRRLAGLRQRAAARAAGGLRRSALARRRRPVGARPLLRPLRGGAAATHDAARARSSQGAGIRGDGGAGGASRGAPPARRPLRRGPPAPVQRRLPARLRQPRALRPRLPAAGQEHRGHHLHRPRRGPRRRGLPAPRGEGDRAPQQAGGNWRVWFRDLQYRVEGEVEAPILVLAAGTLGSTRLLLKSRRRLRALSPALGSRFSGNGDALGLAVDPRALRRRGRAH